MCERLALYIRSMLLNLVAYFCIFKILLAFCSATMGCVAIVRVGGGDVGAGVGLGGIGWDVSGQGESE